MVYCLRHDVDWHQADEEINFRRMNQPLTADHLKDLVFRHTGDWSQADSAAAKFILNATRKTNGT